MRFIQPLAAIVALAACQAAPESFDARMPERGAALGIRSSIPTQECADEMGLEFQVRQQGRVVESVAAGSAAAEAGLEAGDVLLGLDEVTIYSQDDIDDFLSVNEPGATVRATIVRRGTREREDLAITLGTGAAREAGKIRWEFASLAQLPAAIERARAEKKKVLVGLSGAET